MCLKTHQSVSRPKGWGGQMASVPSPDQTVPCSVYSMQLRSLGRGVLGSSLTQRGVLKLSVPLGGIQGPLTSAGCLNSQTRLLSGWHRKALRWKSMYFHGNSGEASRWVAYIVGCSIKPPKQEKPGFLSYFDNSVGHGDWEAPQYICQGQRFISQILRGHEENTQ